MFRKFEDCRGYGDRKKQYLLTFFECFVTTGLAVADVSS